jgi:dihydropyrimidine dehydrogenase (NAD+) subunit PreA
MSATDGKAHGGYAAGVSRCPAWLRKSPLAGDGGLPISGIGGIRLARRGRLPRLGAATVQVCTAADSLRFKIIDDLVDGLDIFLDRKGFASVRELVGKAVPSVTDWQYLNLNHVDKAWIDQDLCIKCGRCHIACEDTAHQAITASVNGVRH